MSTLTRIYTKPIVKVEIGMTFDLNEEKVVILEEGLLYKVLYVAPNTSGDSDNSLHEIIGRVAKIERVATSGMGFNPFYNGDLYNIIFDYSVDFFSAKIVVSTAQIRDIDLYELPVEDDTENEGSDITEPEGPEGSESTEPDGPESTEPENGSESTEPEGSESNDPSTSEPEGSESESEPENGSEEIEETPEE